MNINGEEGIIGSTPLHVAAAKSQWSAMECLVGWGAALNPVDNSGNIPLHIVTAMKSSDALESPQLNQVNTVDR